MSARTRGRPRASLELSDSEREQLQRWAQRRTTAQALVQRARIILESAGGKTDTAVADLLSISPQTVAKWRKRFSRQRLRGLTDAARPGAPRKIDERIVRKLVVRTMDDRPSGATHWTTRMLAREFDISQSAVSRIWRDHGLQPWRQAAFKLSPDPVFHQKIVDLIGLHLDLPVKAYALCIDPGHKPVQDRRTSPSHARKPLPPIIQRGEERIVALGRIVGMNEPAKRGGTRPLLGFLREVTANTPRELEIHIVLDDSLQRPSMLSWLIRRPWLRVHFTPHATAWLHELRLCYLGLAEEQSNRGRAVTANTLIHVLDGLLSDDTLGQRPFTWVKPTVDIELARAQKYMRTYNST